MTHATTPLDLNAFRQRSTARFRIAVSSLYGDLDPNGHINHARYLTYLEECRLAFRRELAEVDPEIDGYSWPIGKLSIRYVSSLHYPQLVTVELSPVAVGRTSYTLGYGVYADERCCAVALTRTVRIDNATNEAVPLTEALAGRLSQLLSASGT